MNYIGDFTGTETLFFPFQTFGGSNESITITGLAVTDIEVYRGTSMTQRASDAGYTLVDTDGIDLDGITGIHGVSIDISDDTDAGFYAGGNDFMVVISAITVNSQTVNFIAGKFSIRNRFPYVYANVPIPILGVIASGTAQAVAAGNLQLAAGETFADDEVIGSVGLIADASTGVGQSRVFSDYVSSTDTASVSPNWTTTPTGTVDYVIHASPPTPTDSATLPAVNPVSWNGVSLSTTNPLPNAAAGGNGGLPTVDASNYVAGVQGTLNTLDALSTALNDISVADILTTQMTESYAADGTAPTLAQAIFLIQQSVGDFSVSGTTLTVKELDGTTTAATYTLDDSVNPTSRTRST